MGIIQKVYEIVVIEDNPGDFSLVESYLHEQFSVLNLYHCIDFKEAKELLNGTNKFDVVILDLSLPDITGFKLISEMINLCFNTPILVLTGYADIEFGIKSLAMGVSDYIIKDDLTPMLLHKSILYSLERKKSIAVLQESEQQYSKLFHLSPQPMWVFDSHFKKFLDANNAAICQYGYSKQEFLTMTMEQIENQINIDYAFQTTDNTFDCQTYTIHQKKNGEPIKVDIHSSTIEFKGLEAHLILANDISERLNYIEAIEVQNKKLKEISWIQSHKVRAPVAKILGLLPLINQDSDDRERIMEYLNISVSELDQVIKDMSKKICIRG